LEGFLGVICGGTEQVTSKKTGSRIAEIETTPAALGRRDVASIFALLAHYTGVPGTTHRRFLPAAFARGIKMARRILCGLISLIRFVCSD